MTRMSEKAAGIAYPRMTAAHINAVIRVMAESQRHATSRETPGDEQQAFAYLVGFYTKRWGLPPSLTGRG